ncbi:MAG: hypothetical protein M3492_14050 [Actinomycetota bacterium]|nr:hypothetical protein [Actinomycetota bacterium]
MPALSAQRRKLRSHKATAVRLGHHDEAQRLDTELRAERLADAIRATVDVAPALTPHQRDALAALLRPTSGAA